MVDFPQLPYWCRRSVVVRAAALPRYCTLSNVAVAMPTCPAAAHALVTGLRAVAQVARRDESQHPLSSQLPAHW